MSSNPSAVDVNAHDNDINWELFQRLFHSTMIMSSDRKAVHSGIEDGHINVDRLERGFDSKIMFSDHRGVDVDIDDDHIN